jgi:TatD DNase family protein
LILKKEIEDFSSHDYSRILKKEQLAKQLLDNGFYISFGKIIAQSRIGISFTSIPNNRFLETDTVEETIREVYLAAKYKNITVTEIQKK